MVSYKEYSSKDLLKKRLYEKIGRFLKSITLDEHNLINLYFENTFAKGIVNDKMSKAFFIVTFNIHFYNTSPDTKSDYPLIEEYLLKVMNQLSFKIEDHNKNFKKVLVSKLDYNTIRKIRLNKNDYEVFRESERFGL